MINKMKTTAVEWLYDNLNKCFDKLDNGEYPYTDFANESKEVREQAKEMEKQQQGYSEEEVLKFTQTMLMQYKFGNTDIEQMDLLKETLQLFKKK